MFPTTFNTETELSAVNSILGSIGQSPITKLNFQNPEISFAYQLLQEANTDIQNEGWTFNREQNYPLIPDSEGYIQIPENVLRMDVSGNDVCKTTDVVKRDGRLYDKMRHSYTFDRPMHFDIVWLFKFEDLPSAFRRYIVAKASTRAATQMVANPQLSQLLSQQEAITRSTCIEYECNQGDFTMLGTPQGASYRPYIPFNGLDR